MPTDTVQTRPAPEGATLRVVGHAPHIAAPDSTRRIMWSVVAALAPAAVAAGYWFGYRAYLHIALALATALLTEALIQKLTKRPVTILDGSAAVTGVLVAFCLPAQARWFVPVTASFVAIAIAKHCFGGLGSNIWNPALVGRAFVHNAFPVDMNPAGYPTVDAFAADVGTVTGATPYVDAVTQASPLAHLKTLADGTAEPVAVMANQMPSLWKMFVGDIGGNIGETSALLLILGALYLIGKGWVRWPVPVAYVGVVAAGAALFGWLGPAGPLPGRFVLSHVLGGGLMLGALYMATDMVTSPLTERGQWIFGAGCGALTITIRLWGGYPEAVCYSILLMNTAVPLIDRWMVRRIFGHQK